MFSGKSSPLQRKPTADDQADADADIALQKLAIDAQWKASDGRCYSGCCAPGTCLEYASSLAQASMRLKQGGHRPQLSNWRGSRVFWDGARDVRHCGIEGSVAQVSWHCRQRIT